MDQNTRANYPNRTQNTQKSPDPRWRRPDVQHVLEEPQGRFKGMARQPKEQNAGKPRRTEPGGRLSAKRVRGGKLSPTDKLLVGILGGFALIVLAVFLVFGLYTYYTMTDMILPGVMVNDIPLNGLSKSEAAEKIDQEMNTVRELYVTSGQNIWRDTHLAFGLFVDSYNTALDAYDVGRGPGGLREFFAIIFKHSWNVLPVITVDRDTAATKLDLYTDLVAIPPRDARLALDDGEWLVMPGEYGAELDIEKTVAELQANPALVYSSGYLALSLKPIPPNFEDFSFSLDSMEPLLNTPMHFRAYDPILDEDHAWTVEPQEFAEWIYVNNLDGEPDPQISAYSFGEYLTEWQQGLSGGRFIKVPDNMDEMKTAWQSGQTFPLTIWHLPTTYQVQAGDMLSAISYKVQMPYWKILEANPQLDPEKLYTGTDLIIPSRNEMLPLPIVMDKRIVVSITQQRMWLHENGQIINEYIISTGIDDSPTLPGVYQVQTHDINAYASVWDLYMPHFMGIYEGWPGFMNGIHGLPTLSSGVTLWASVLGSKASYGCIILDLPSAERVYNWAGDGVVVEILP